MPIKVTCQCGKSFAAKDELAGKAVKCPNCQQPLRIPLAQSAAPLPSSAPSQPRMPSQPATSAAAFGPPAGGGGAHSLFDEVGLKQAPAGAAMCPGCAAPLPSGAVICIKCGYNLKLGRRMETVRMGAGGGPGGHGAHEAGAADLMNKAAVSIEEDKEEERRKTREGMPWWVYLIGLLFAIGFIIMMMVLPQQRAMQVGGGLITLIGTIVILYSYVRILIVAFTENPGFGVLVFLTGCFGLIFYSIARWDRCGGYFLMWLGGQVVQGMGYGAILLAEQFGGGQEQAEYRHPPVPLMVVRAEAHWTGPMRTS